SIREILCHRHKVCGLEAMLAQRMAQSIETAATLFTSLARINAQRPLGSEISLIPPPHEGCNIMRSERNQRIFSIIFGRKKRAVASTLEQHDLIRPDAPIRERLAKICGNGAEVFPHDNAPMFHTR